MQHSFQAFMAHLIDYAGLFPPARLPLDQTVQNYLRYLQEPDAWMLARLIIPAAQLEALGGLLGEAKIKLSILGTGGATREAFLDSLHADAAKIEAFRQTHGRQTDTGFFEVRLPQDDDLAGLIREASAILGEMRVFYELSPGQPVREAAQALGAYSRAHRLVGMKVRCGGEQAAAFPSPAQVAAVIASCAEARIPLKATAGLHHPLRHFNTDVQTHMHGFLNLFGAGVLAQAHRLDQAMLEAILADEDAAHFMFTDEYFAWRDLRITTGDLLKARQSALISYGSCSFDEPREDLMALGLLEHVGS